MLSTNPVSEKTNRGTDVRVRRQVSAAFLIVLISLLASCKPTGEPIATATPSPKPPTKIGGRVFGVECNPATLEMNHGETKEIQLADVGGEGRVTSFIVGTVRGDGKIEVSQTPKRNNTGWSALPGAIQIKSTAVDGPTRTETYYIEILLGGRQGDRLAGGNIWCQVDVKHVAPPTPTLTPTPTPTLTPTSTPTPEYIVTGPSYVITDDGFRVTYSGQLEVPSGGTLAAPFQVWTPEGLPAKGDLTVSLWVSSSDPNAVHATAELDTQGEVTIPLDIDWSAGTILELLFSHDGKVYKLTDLTVTP